MAGEATAAVVSQAAVYHRLLSKAAQMSPVLNIRGWEQ